jgi:hypothetical protein
MICEKCNKLCVELYPAIGLAACPGCLVVYHNKEVE